MPYGSVGIERFNALSDRRAVHALFEICSSTIWARRVVKGRPFADAQALFDRADRVLAELPEAELDAALDGHPRIGARVEANSTSSREQAAVQSAGEGIREALGTGNRKYEEKFGHVYLVCASGRPAEELYAILEERLENDPETERRVMRSELAKINRLRLDRLLRDPPRPEGEESS
ncbi:2-oxo-4-hydroxy-4-carboxy-5-ureidoimidazoline decarboxylase [Aldersonia sp. NBC_00410]|uniref:2-oxo-4-hydroxy-4-carboxy-5-ureidoimidazoline decarboxylase n=1 Tax=Aldersonia sp. NBC_00410 TaxID=2975954 RepID=UPI00224D7274|nr:2-oxo-4-hydroxy-4-carboxy-5-ureidoimidazoline decarboxylase [Aldersonia sp. NBC_00410]MCX5044505.1 2-oxo-4-hydroxy-4-carboxy-5-ureidoimidazoline decarboxylase [Aldersonia sp. NBC_00410]